MTKETKSVVSPKTLEEISLESLWNLCPLCGQFAENSYCKDCKFQYEKGKLYLSRPINIIHCPTKELFTKVQEHEFAKGNCWIDSSREVRDCWDDYRENTCISLLDKNGWRMLYSPKSFYEEDYPNVKIISANEYLMEINTGDIFVDCGRKRKALAVIGDLVAMSSWGDFDMYGFWYTKSEIENNGWKKEGTEDSEVAEAIKVLEKAGKIKDGKILE